jgi:hypothetical protein
MQEIQKNYGNHLRVTLGKKNVSIAYLNTVEGIHRYACISLTSLHFLTLLAYLTHPDCIYARSNYDPANKCHSVLCNEGVKIIQIQYGSGGISQFLMFDDPDGRSGQNGIELDPKDPDGLATDILTHLGENRCRCEFCEDVLNNTSYDPLLHAGRP